MANKQEGNKPKKTVRVGAISATVWENEREVKGKMVKIASINLARNYKDKEGKWQSTEYLGTNDLPKAILALQKVYEELVLKEDEDSQ